VRGSLLLSLALSRQRLKAEADDEQMILRWPLIYYRRKMRFLSPQLVKIAQGLGRAGRSIGEGGN